MSPSNNEKRPLESESLPPAKRASLTPIDGPAIAIASMPVPTPVKLGQLLVKKLSDKARLPTRGSKHAAGFDLYSAKAMTIPAQSQGIVPTDISIAVPEGTYGRVAPRSGLAVKHFVDTGAGVVDFDYRGPVGVVLFNFGKKDFVIEEGDRVAQLVLEKIHMCDAVEVEDLDDTERGSGGFGSTGVKLA
ncbi:dUTP pyrophosphatase [Entomortierella parvispora]|uniref:Deoxyuridine 5'-triphosphate nucleotidohydrolase n=1 Tax=Entomortierella parvispora TaxID=205924 RepID=A0A9P3HGN6_9FUNG|nr:dUTP pyrophosphatase [Entomortierella parvispora]